MIFSNFLKLKFIIKNLTYVFAFTLSLSICAQNNETNNWLFGQYAGLNFETPDNVQAINNSSMFAPAGCASISDFDGNLLFYTNSQTIWNKNHDTMANGANINGNAGADQNSIIVPIPNSVDQYYVFSIGTDGFYYSTVDMTANVGLGEVIENDILLLSGAEIGKVTAVHHDDGQSIWVLTTKKNDNDDYFSFYAYKINTDGTIDNPIITDNLYFAGRKEGIMKFSPDGTKIAISNFLDDDVNKHLYTFTFDSSNGEVSNRRSLFTTKVFFEVVSAYGLAFSKDSNKLYATLRRQGMLDTSTGTVPEDSEKKDLLVQYDLETYNGGSEITILHENIGVTIPGSLQLAKNGKIYRALTESPDIGSDNVGVINSPLNLESAVNYNHTGIQLSGSFSRLGLPNFIQSYFRTRITSDTFCKDKVALFEVDTYSNITAAQWDFGDGNTSNDIIPSHTYESTGTFNITATITVNDRQITTSKRISVFDTPDLIASQELIQCDSDTDGISVFNLNNIKERILDNYLEEEFTFFESFEDADQNSNPISNPENYTNLVPNQEVFAKVYNSNGCPSITSFFLNAIYTETIDIPDFYVCENSDNIDNNDEGLFMILEIKEHVREALNIPITTDINFYPSLADAQTTQNDIRSNLTSSTTTVWIRAEESGLACSGLAPINLIVNSVPIIDLEDEYTFCQNEPIVLTGHNSNTRFEWLNSSGELLFNTRQFTSYTSGTYTHIAYKVLNGVECSNSKTFTLIQNEPPIFENIDVDLNYDNNTIVVEVSGNSNYEYSIDNLNFYGNANTYTFQHIPSGIQTIYVRDINQCEETIFKKLYLIGYPKFITPNNDSKNDFWRIKGVDTNNFESIRIFDRYGKLIAILNEQNSFTWDGKRKDITMPTNDYWFKVIYKDGESATGHFTLKH